MSKRIAWPRQKIDDFKAWHTARMKELNYPDSTVKELTRARDKWLPAEEKTDALATPVLE